jgi:hypothetical protein
MKVYSRSKRTGEEFQIRELNDAECDAMVQAIEMTYRKNYYRIPKHMLDEVMSFLNEEAFLYACKFDGRGDMVGYIVSSLSLRVSSYLGLHVKREKRNLYDEYNSEDDGSLFDVVPYEVDFEEVDLFAQMDKLPSRTLKVMKLLYDGHSSVAITSILGI